MKRGNLIIATMAGAFLLLAGGSALAAKGGIKGKPPPMTSGSPWMDYLFYFWKLGIWMVSRLQPGLGYFPGREGGVGSTRGGLHESLAHGHRLGSLHRR